MMLECSTGELLTRALFMHHDDQGHGALMHHAILKGLKGTRKLLFAIVAKTRV